MNKYYPVLCCLILMIAAFLVSGPNTSAGEDSQFDHQIQDTRASRAQVESKLGLDPNADPFPQATCYYDDLVDHYEVVMLGPDEIGQGI